MNMENNITSVQFIKEQIKLHSDTSFFNIDWNKFDEVIEKAEKINKENFYKCASFWRGKENKIEKPIFEQYYNETFKLE